MAWERSLSIFGALSLFGGVALADVGGHRPSAPGDDSADAPRAEHPVGDEEPLSILSSPPAGKVCTSKSGVCFFAGRATVAVQSAPVAAVGKPGVASAPRFSRATTVAKVGNAPSGGGAWALDLVAALRHPAWSGNAVFSFYDLEDPRSVAQRQTTALFQTAVKAGKGLAAHLSLSGEDGFRAGHTYRLRVAQIIANKEVVLAEGDFSLL